jgi:hypothetical protein
MRIAFYFTGGNVAVDLPQRKKFEAAKKQILACVEQKAHFVTLTKTHQGDICILLDKISFIHFDDVTGVEPKL